MIRNSITIYEDDAMTIVGAIENLIDFIEQYEPNSRLNKDYKQELLDLKTKIEKAVI